MPKSKSLRAILMGLFLMMTAGPVLADSHSGATQANVVWRGVMVEQETGNYFWLDLRGEVPGQMRGRLHYGEWSGRLSGEIDRDGGLSLSGREEETQIRVQGRLDGAGGAVSVTFRNGAFQPWKRGTGLLVRDDAEALTKAELDSLLAQQPNFRLHYGRSGHFARNGDLASEGTNIGRWWTSDAGELCYDVRVPEHFQWCSPVFGADGAYRMLDPEIQGPVWFEVSN